jgi:calcineurin-like phosphoesterase
LWDDDAYFAIIRPNGQPLRLEINNKFDTIRTVLEEINKATSKVIQDLHASC